VSRTNPCATRQSIHGQLWGAIAASELSLQEIGDLVDGDLTSSATRMALGRWKRALPDPVLRLVAVAQVLGYKVQLVRKTMLEVALEKFIAEEFENSATSGPEAMVVELFHDGSYRTLRKSAVGNRYDSEGVILQIPQLTEDDDWDAQEAAMFDALAEAVTL
jgi:hypothetical protein